MHSLSVLCVVLTSVAGVVSVGVCVLPEVWVAGPSQVDVTNMLMVAVKITIMLLTSTKHKRQ